MSDSILDFLPDINFRGGGAICSWGLYYSRFVLLLEYQHAIDFFWCSSVSTYKYSNSNLQ